MFCLPVLPYGPLSIHSTDTVTCSHSLAFSFDPSLPLLLSPIYVMCTVKVAASGSTQENLSDSHRWGSLGFALQTLLIAHHCVSLQISLLPSCMMSWVKATIESYLSWIPGALLITCHMVSAMVWIWYVSQHCIYTDLVTRLWHHWEVVTENMASSHPLYFPVPWSKYLYSNIVSEMTSKNNDVNWSWAETFGTVN